MTTPNFGGRRVLAFESRRAVEIGALIRNFGGVPVVAPAMKESPLESDAAVSQFARDLAGGRFDAVVFLTGAGVRALVDVAARDGIRDTLLSSLATMRVITRGPKPLGALRELGVFAWLNAPEPNTWRELVAALDAHAGEWTVRGARVAIQEYGAPSRDLIDALQSRGAIVTAVPTYRWMLPDDVEPLRAAAAMVARGEVDVVVVTSGIQIVHFWRIVREAGLEADVRRQMARATIASIGPSASAEIRRHGFEPAFEPEHPKMGLLLREAAVRVSA
jgi:uroporphyrinogen-III synthase